MTSELMPEEIRHDLIRSALAGAPGEIVGFLLKDWTIVYMRNAAVDEGFRIDDAELLDFYRCYIHQCAGIFHSHPKGRKEPSNVDVEYAPDGMRYWIVTLDNVYEWDMSNGTPILVT